METQTYYVIKPTTHLRKKVTYGDALELTESQARPLRHGGFISPDKAAAERIAELIAENQRLRDGKKSCVEDNSTTPTEDTVS